MIYAIQMARVILCYHLAVITKILDLTSGKFLVILALLIFAFYGVIIRWIPATPLTILFFSSLFGACFFFFTLTEKDIAKKLRHLIFPLFGFTLIAILNDFAYFHAFRLTTIANAVLTHYTAPIFVALLAPMMLKEKLGKHTIIALLLSFLGLIILLSPSHLTLNTNFMGISAGLFSGLMYALFIIKFKDLSKSFSVSTINFYRYLITCILLFPVLFIEKPLITFNLIGQLAIFSLIFTVLAVWLHTEGIKRVKAQDVGIIGYIEPLAAAIYGVIFFSEIPNMVTLIGGSLILLGTYLILKEKS